MVFGALADVHGNFDAMSRAMERHPEVPFWLCVGDLASRAGEYPEPPAPLYWIKGNNENFDRIADWQAGTKPLRNLYFVANGTAAEAGKGFVLARGGAVGPPRFETPPFPPPPTPPRPQPPLLVD